MKAHELAEKLLAMPNYDIMAIDECGPAEISNPYEYKITDDDADNCGWCEDIIGNIVIAVRLNT